MIRITAKIIAGYGPHFVLKGQIGMTPTIRMTTRVMSIVPSVTAGLFPVRLSRGYRPARASMPSNEAMGKFALAYILDIICKAFSFFDTSDHDLSICMASQLGEVQ
jgi:hypothetical protein